MEMSDRHGPFVKRGPYNAILLFEKRDSLFADWVIGLLDRLGTRMGTDWLRMVSNFKINPRLSNILMLTSFLKKYY